MNGNSKAFKHEGHEVHKGNRKIKRFSFVFLCDLCV